MRIQFMGIALGLALVFGLVPGTNAEPLDLKQVSADAKWLGHVDVDALRASTLVQKAIAKHLETHKDAEKHRAAVREMLGMDPLKDVHGLTVYGKEIGKPSGVMIVHAKWDQNRLKGLAGKVPNLKTTKYESYDLHSFTHKGPKESHTIVAAFFKPEVLVVASGEGEIKAALGVLEGKSASLGTEGPLAGRTPPGTIALFRATGLAEAKLPHKPIFLKHLESYRGAVGENEGQSFYRARAVLTNADVVDQVKTVIEGIRAFARLHIGGDEKGKKIMDGFQLTSEGNTLRVRWNASAADVWDMLQTHGKIFAEKKAKMGLHLKQRAKEPKKIDKKEPEKKKE